MNSEKKRSEDPVTTSTTAEFPAFVFERQHHVETEAGFVLAGLLIVDLPESSKMSNEEVCLLGEIVQQLGELAESGKMPDDAIVTGWRGGRKPSNAVDTNDDALMSAWAERSIGIVLRIQPRCGADHLRIVSDAPRHTGIGSGALREAIP
jgi:hypothetical protein